MTYRRFLLIALLGSRLVPACLAQGLPAALNPANSSAEGFRLYSISTFVGFSRFSFPRTAGDSAILANDRKMYGVMGSIGWQHFRGRTNFSLRYNGAYTGVVRQTNTRGTNQTASVTLSRAFGTKLTADIALTGQDASFDQFIFQPSTLGSLSQSAAGVDDLAAALSVGQFSSSANAVLLSGAASGADPTRAVLLGNRTLTYAARAGLVYDATPRLHLRFGSFAVGGQSRRGDPIPGAQQNYILPRTIGGDAGVSVDYDLSPRTSLDFGVTENYMSSAFQKSAGTNIFAGAGRRMSRRWFVRGYAGGYFVNARNGASAASRQIVGGGSLGFKTYGNTFLASFTRSGYDANVGIVGSNYNINGAWSWRRPRNSWGVHASYGRIESNNPGQANISGWQGAAGFLQRLGGGLIMTASFTYLDSRGAYLGLANRVTATGARITIGWAPKNRQRITQEATAPEDSK